ncbi:MAG: hypothetical protein KatS3mg055_3754 [Chloroflexus sp.]|nr:metalloregulator ArsR/SmtB family transcription factor [Chloroflexus sp.]GIV91236.1 MAG: hypothetical protein KatS3mg055_3754 [Chloroflexus sp.]
MSAVKLSILSVVEYLEELANYLWNRPSPARSTRLSDPTRRAILQMLNERDMTAGEIAARFAISAPSVSHHLSVLKAADLVTAERRGQHIDLSPECNRVARGA